MNWNELYTGRFFAAGATMWDGETQEYRHTKHFTSKCIVGTYETTENSMLFENIDKYQNKTPDASIRPSLYRMMRYLTPETRNELHLMYQKALSVASSKFTSWYASGLALVPPNANAASHIHFADPNKYTFTYAFSSKDTLNKSYLVVDDKQIPLPENASEFYFYLNSSLAHSTIRNEEDKNGYLFFTFDDVDVSNLSLQENAMYVQV